VKFHPAGRASACLIVATGVALGAFGAHGIKPWLEEVGRSADLDIWKTAVLYHLVHAAFLAAAGDAIGKASSLFFRLGILLFSGTLYLLVLTDARWLGAITPLGGVGLILGWVAAAWQFRKTGGEGGQAT
jgi:uncharacterized membrane protein YgdD (TMEM256/DUF423 family)